MPTGVYLHKKRGKPSEETIQKIKLTLTGRKCSKEHRKNMSIGKTGGSHSDRLPSGLSAFNTLYRVTKYNAIKRGYTFNISKELFGKIVKQNCFYCGCPPSNIATRNKKLFLGVFTYNGLDRKDNSVGYLEENIVSCCKTCNYAKHTLSFNDFMEWIKRLCSFQTEKK